VEPAKDAKADGLAEPVGGSAIRIGYDRKREVVAVGPLGGSFFWLRQDRDDGRIVLAELVVASGDLAGLCLAVATVKIAVKQENDKIGIDLIDAERIGPRPPVWEFDREVCRRRVHTGRSERQSKNTPVPTRQPGWIGLLPAFDQPDDPYRFGPNGLVFGDWAAADKHRHLLWAVVDRCQQVSVGCPVVNAHLMGGLTDDLDGHVHTTAIADDCEKLSTPRVACRVGLGVFICLPAANYSMSDADAAGATGREIWIEKYRPQTLDDIKGQADIVERLQSYIDQHDLPHLLFSGGAGIGKTTAATAIARQVYGDDWQGNFLELNASDQRGIDVVRDRIKNFARASFGGYDYRIIFLDEADSLTSDAQSALRRTMEQFSDNTRFILSCNYSSKIIDPIQSRCAVFRFSPLSDEAIAAQVDEIAAIEDIELTDDGREALVYAAGGDMRRAINSLQAAATTGEIVDEEAVYLITSTARPEEIEAMVTDAINGDFAKSRATLDTLLTDTGMAGGDIIDQLHRSVWDLGIDERAAVRLMERIGEADYRITEGANEQVQLEALLASLALDDS